MDLETTEPASSRRRLIGVAGLAGAAAALLSASRVSAAPSRPTEQDLVGLDAALRLELSARDLYRAAASQLDEDTAQLAMVIAENHEAYAQSIAGLTGSSSGEHNAEVFDALEGAFSTSDAQAFAAAARDLENAAVATHTDLLGGYEGIGPIELTASILVVEARQAAVFTSMAGFADNLDDMLGSDAEALELTGGAA